MPRNTLAREVMVTDVLKLSPDESVRDAMIRLVDRDIDAAPVVDTDGKVVGMLSTSDLIVQETRLHVPAVISVLGAYIELPSSARHFEKDLERALGATVREVMSADPVTCHEDDTIEQIATQMHERDVSRVPVVASDGRLVGLVARGDIVRAIVRKG